jgi:hypothetical protein
MQDAFGSESHLSVLTLLERQCAALILGIAVAWIYALTHKGFRGAGNGRSGRSRKSAQPVIMMATLVLLTVLIGMIASVVGDSVARAFALVGALSIVRFRTVVEDTRDTAFVIFAVAVGLAVGTGYIKVPLIGLPFVAIAALVFRPGTFAAFLGPGAATVASEPWTVKVKIAPDFVSEDALAQALESGTRTVELTELAALRVGEVVERIYSVRVTDSAGVPQLANAIGGVTGVIGVEVKRA